MASKKLIEEVWEKGKSSKVETLMFGEKMFTAIRFVSDLMGLKESSAGRSIIKTQKIRVEVIN